jgi:L-alanine-DL-glutamate epimerase-like enolase superfamily enzyme
MPTPKLTLKSVDVRAVLLPLKRPVVSKVGLFDQWPMVLIDLYTHEGIVGRSYLEPYLRQSVKYIVPAIRDLAEAVRDKPIAPFDAFRAGRTSLGLVGLEGMSLIAVSGLDMALWDALAKARRVPLWKLLADRYNGGKYDDTAWVYAAGGYYYPGKDLSMLRGEMRGYLDRGYNVVKMKIGGAPISEDRTRIEAVLKEIGKEAQLAVDANGRFDLETAIAYAKMLRDYPLFWYEEAGDPLDFQLQAALAEFYPGPMATGENLFSHQDARNLIRHGGMRPDRDWLQFDCALSYGLCEYQRTLGVLQASGWSPSRCIPHGGHQMSLNIAAGLGLGGNESYPDLFQPYGGFPDGVRVESGHITMPDLPGIGFEGKTDLYAEMKALAS